MYASLKAFFRDVAMFLKLRQRQKLGATYDISTGDVLVLHGLGEDEIYDSEYEEGESTITYVSPRFDLQDFEIYSGEADSVLSEPITGVYFLDLNPAQSEE